MKKIKKNKNYIQKLQYIWYIYSVGQTFPDRDRTSSSSAVPVGARDACYAPKEAQLKALQGEIGATMTTITPIT